MKNFLIVLLVIGMSQKDLSSQNLAKIDSAIILDIFHKITSVNDLPEKAKKLHDFGTELFESNPDLSLILFQEEKKLLSPSQKTEIAKNWLSIGSCFESLNKLDSARKYLQLVVGQDLFNNDQFRAYLKISDTYYKQGEFNLAYEIVSSLEDNIYKYSQVEYFRLPAMKGYLHLERNIDSCIYYYNEAIAELPSISQMNSELIKELVEIFISVGWGCYYAKPAEASNFFNKALNLMPKGFDEWSSQKWRIHNNLGIVAYDLEKDCDKGVNLLRKSIAYHIYHTQNQPLPLFQNTLHNLGEAFLCAEKYDSALHYFQKVMTLRVPSFLSMDYRDNPTEEQLYLSNNKMGLRNQFDYKCQALQAWYGESKDPTIPPLVLETYQRLDLLIDLIRREHLEPETRNYWRGNTFKYYEKAIEACDKYGFIKEALYFSEKAKSILLLEDINGKLAATAIPQDLKESRRAILKSITKFQDSLANTHKYDLNPEHCANINSKVLEAKFALEKLNRELTKLPNYLQIHYEDQEPIIRQKIQNMEDDEMILEYFWGDSNLYIFAISKENIRLHNLAKDTLLFHQIDSLKSFLSNPDHVSISDFARLSHMVYNKLIKPLGPLPEKLTIIPDDLLYYIPFEILISEMPSQQPSYFTLPYLNQKHEMGYAFSIALADKMEGHPVINHQFLSVAPSYSGHSSIANSRRSGLQSLVYNQILPEYLGEHWNASTLVGKNATIEQFTRLASKMGYISMSMHAVLNDTLPDDSYLAFSDHLDHYKLEVKDIYQLNLNADLISLNACETGIGKLQRGEGMISLGRSFIYAGTRSLLTSLWKVNDLATANIMISFHQNLEKGYTKSKSLQLAKQHYLQTASIENAHPYYWSAFVLNGAKDPIRRNYWRSTLVLILAGLGGLLVLFLLIKRVKIN